MDSICFKHYYDAFLKLIDIFVRKKKYVIKGKFFVPNNLFDLAKIVSYCKW